MLVSDLCPKRRISLIVDVVGRDRMFILVDKMLWSKVRLYVFINLHKKPMTFPFCKEKVSINSRW